MRGKTQYTQRAGARSNQSPDTQKRIVLGLPTQKMLLGLLFWSATATHLFFVSFHIHIWNHDTLNYNMSYILYVTTCCT